MHKRWSKLALRASLPKRIRRALADSAVAAVRGVVADKIGVPLDGLSQTHGRAPEEAQASEPISKHIGANYLVVCLDLS